MRSSKPEAPLFMQVASSLEDDIFRGRYLENTQVPSTTEISAAEKINPATVLKGVNILVDRGILEKRRGIGMFVAQGAVDLIRERRRSEFGPDFVEPIVEEAVLLGLGKEEVLAIVGEAFGNET